MFGSQYRHAKAHQEMLIEDARRSHVSANKKNWVPGLNTFERFLLNISDLLIGAGEWIRCSMKSKVCESVRSTAQ